MKWFTLVDEYTRECLALEVERGMTAKGVGAVLAGVVRERGAPAHIRSDHGPEFIAQAIRAWMASAGLETLYIDPGAPWENGYAESFNGKVRDELLDAEEFGSVLEAKVLAKGVAEGVRPGPTSQLVGVSDASGVRGDGFSGRLRCAGPRNHP